MGYIFDVSKGETPETIKRQREIVRALMGAQRAPQNVGEGISALGDGIVANVLGRRADSAEKSGLESANAAMGPLAAMFGGGAEAAGGTPAAPHTAPGGGTTMGGAVGTPDMDGNAIYSEFMDNIKKGGVTNPNALAAIAATGKSESGFSPGNVYRAWSDPSESGGGGSAGGIMSWRAERLDNMRKFVAANGGDPSKPSPALQAQFLLHEDPSLIASLSKAQSPEEAQQMMNNAWKFAGYNRPGGEAGRRIALARNFAGSFQGAPAEVAPTQVASLDPSAGLPPAGAPAAQAPAGNQQAVIQALAEQGIAADSPQAQAFASIGAGGSVPAQAPAQQQITQALAQAPQQVAQADIGMGGGQGGGAFPSAPGSGDAKIQQLLAAAQNPYLSESQQAIVKALLGEEMQKRDPAYSLDLETKRAQLDALKGKKQKNWQKLDDNTLFDPDSGETKEIGTSGGPTKFEGTGLDAQAWNILQSADPSSKEYATAYSIVSQPKTQLVQTENGMMPVEVPPQLPAWLKAPGAAGEPVAAPGVAPAAPAAQPGADVPPVAPGNVIAGTKKPKTEAQGRNATITTILEGEIPTLNDNWGALADPAGQLLAKLPGGLGNMWQSEEFQRAAYSVSAGATNILYSLSGASSNPGEVLNQGRLLLPQFGDKPGAIADKLDRFKTYVKGVALQSGDQELVSSVNSALEKLTGKPSAKPTGEAPQAPDDTPPPASYTGKNWKWMTPEQRALWQ